MQLGYYLLFVLLLLILAWFFIARKQAKEAKKNNFPQDYLIGLNYLLSEQPDKAVDIFIRLLEVDSDTVETHLALGHLFRRRGEVDRAIRIHQNLIARPELTKKQRTQAMLALGEDYLRAGVLDRAERLLQEVANSSDFQLPALEMLLDIYQQEKEWEKAIATAESLQQLSKRSFVVAIAHYYCELALDTRKSFSTEQSTKYLKRALTIDKNSVRASLLLATWDAEQADYKTAIKSFRRVMEQDPAFLSEIIKPLAECYEKLNMSEDYKQFLSRYLSDKPKLAIMLAWSDLLEREQGARVALDFLTEHLYAHPSLLGLTRLIELQSQAAQGKEKYNLQLLFKMAQQLILQKATYRCENCGVSSKILHWLCPGCRRWQTMKPIEAIDF